MSDFDGVVDSITGSGGVVESAELEVFDVIDHLKVISLLPLLYQGR